MNGKCVAGEGAETHENEYGGDEPQYLQRTYATTKQSGSVRAMWVMRQGGIVYICSNSHQSSGQGDAWG